LISNKSSWFQTNHLDFKQIILISNKSSWFQTNHEIWGTHKSFFNFFFLFFSFFLLFIFQFLHQNVEPGVGEMEDAAVARRVVRIMATQWHGGAHNTIVGSDLATPRMTPWRTDPSLPSFEDGWGNVNKNMPLFLSFLLEIEWRVGYNNTFETKFGVKILKLDKVPILGFLLQGQWEGQSTLALEWRERKASLKFRATRFGLLAILGSLWHTQIYYF
jgi:hypothetical protein